MGDEYHRRASGKIAILVEGETEKALMPSLRRFLNSRLPGKMPKLKAIVYNGRIPKQDKLKRDLEKLPSGKDAYDAVIALTDVYTGTEDFKNAADAKQKMKEWAGNNPNFYPHAAQHDFEVWLLPFWPTIQKLAKHNKSVPSGNPEKVNHHKPPSKHIQEIFKQGKSPRSYSKTRDAAKILEENDLMESIKVCSELKAFINTIIQFCCYVAVKRFCKSRFILKHANLLYIIFQEFE